MAENTHEVRSKTWSNKKWPYGSKRNDDLKKHPCLVTHNELPEEAKAHNQNTHAETLKFIIRMGLKIT